MISGISSLDGGLILVPIGFKNVYKFCHRNLPYNYESDYEDL